MKISQLTFALASLALAAASNAATILGIGTGALLGGDLTDPENDGTPAGANYNATFDASQEASFTDTNEPAFSVFTNTVGEFNHKWCCGGGSFPLWVEATFSDPIVLTHFTLTSGNDVLDRDPVVWQIVGSNDGINFDVIHSQNGQAWTDRNQVIRWDGAGIDFATPADYTTIRLNVDSTSGSAFQLNEFEIFGTVVPEPSSVGLIGIASLGLILRRRR